MGTEFPCVGRPSCIPLPHWTFARVRGTRPVSLAVGHVDVAAMIQLVARYIPCARVDANRPVEDMFG
jgi:hypothetical protein